MSRLLLLLLVVDGVACTGVNRGVERQISWIYLRRRVVEDLLLLLLLLQMVLMTNETCSHLLLLL